MLGLANGRCSKVSRQAVHQHTHSPHINLEHSLYDRDDARGHSGLGQLLLAALRRRFLGRHDTRLAGRPWLKHALLDVRARQQRQQLVQQHARLVDVDLG